MNFLTKICCIISLLAIYCKGSICAQDSYAVEKFKVSDGLPSNHITRLAIDKQHRLIVGTQRGLCLYDGYRFSNIPQAGRVIESIFVKGDSIYFHQVGNGIGIIHSKNNSIPEYIIQPDYQDSDPNNDHFNHIYVDTENKIWCIDYQYLKAFEIKGNPVAKHLIKHQITDLLSAFLLAKTHHNYWYLGQHQIIDLLDTQEVKHPITTLFPLLATVAADSATTLAVNKAQEIYLINNSSLNTKKITKLAHSASIRRIIKNGATLYILSTDKLVTLNIDHLTNHCIYQSPQMDLQDLAIDFQTGIIWLATTDGLVKLTPPNRVFTEHPLKGANNEVVIDISISTQKNIVLTKQKVYYSDDNISQSAIKIPNNDAKHLLQFQNTIFVVAQTAIYKLNYPKLEKLAISLPKDVQIKKAIITYNQELWLMQEQAPIIKYDWYSLQQIATNFSNNEAFWTKNKWNDLKEIEGKIWLVGWMPKSFGINYYDATQNKFIDLAETKINHNNQFVGDYYHHIGTTANNELLFSAYGGWNQTNKNGAIQRRIDILEYPIHSDIVKGIVGTKDSTIYFGTSEGLYVYDAKNNSMLAFTEKEGLPQNDITYAFRLTNDSTIALGMKNAWASVHLNTLKETRLLDRLAFTRISIDSENHNPSETIHFNASNHNIQILFSALTFNQQNQIIYRYKFSDDSNWINLGNIPEINLNHLPYGKYKLLIQSGDILGNWSENPLTIQIIAHPPFVKSKTFYALITISIVLLTIGIAKYIIQKTKKEASLQQQSLRNEMRALRAQMNPHFIFNSLNAIHSFIVLQKTDEASNYLTAFAKLLRYILEYSREELITLEKELKALFIYIQLEAARLENKFEYKLEIDANIQQDTTLIPPLIIQPFVENAIWHGIRNIEYKGIITIKIERIHKGIKIEITDNGKGINASAKKTQKAYDRKKFGVSIARERIKLQNPSNELLLNNVQKEEPLGTCVTILLYDL